MTISEAMRESKESGKAYMRASSDGFVGWIKYEDSALYKLHASDLMADDWDVLVKVSDGDV